MATITKRERAEILRSADFFAAAEEHNRQARKRAKPGECGGCFGAGTGANCCICGGKR